MQIRKMRVEDYRDVYDLWLNTPGMGLNDADDSETGIQKYLLRNPDTCYVAEKNGRVIGVILSGHDGRRGLIYHLAVKAGERNRGVGGALLDRALAALRNEGIHKVYAIVFKNNAAGNAFWEKRGFTVPDNTLYRAREIMPIVHTDT